MVVSILCIPSPKGEKLTADFWYHGVISALRSHEHVMGYVIDEIVWYKEKDLVGHEFLVASVQMTNHRRPALIKIERSTSEERLKKIIDDPNPIIAFLGQELEDVPEEAQPDASRVRELLEKKVKDMQAEEAKKYWGSDDSKPDPTIANDQISQVNTAKWEPSKFIQLFTLRFGSDKPFTLRDMGIIVYQLHINHPTYDWKTRNCYWFCRTLMKIIPEITSTSSDGTLDQRAGRPGLALSHFTFPPPIFKKPFDHDGFMNQIKVAIKTDDERLHQIWKEGPGETIRANIAEERRRELEEMRRQMEELNSKLLRENEEIRQQIAWYETLAGPSTVPIS